MVPAPIAFLDHEMISGLKTPVAVLRQMLGLSVEDFGKLIGKSLSTVTKLDNGALPLSEETAHTVSLETGVSMHWLLEGNPAEDPTILTLTAINSRTSKSTSDGYSPRKGK